MPSILDMPWLSREWKFMRGQNRDALAIRSKASFVLHPCKTGRLARLFVRFSRQLAAVDSHGDYHHVA